MKTHSKDWLLQSMGWEERPKFIMCKLASARAMPPPSPKTEEPCAWMWILGVSWNTVELLPEAETDSIDDLPPPDTSVSHPNPLMELKPDDEEEDDAVPDSYLFLDVSHQVLPPLPGKSSAIIRASTLLLHVVLGAICFFVVSFL